MGRCVLWASAAPRLPQTLQMRFYLSYTEVGGVAMDLVQLEMQLVHLNASRWDVGTETSVWFCASLNLWLSVNIGFSAPILQLDKLVFCGNVPKRSSVTLLMPQYMTLNKPLNVFHLIHL